MNKFIFIIIGIVIWMGIMGCGAVDRQYENYDLANIDEIDNGLNQQNHPHGFRQTKCFYCHVKANIHEVNRIGHSNFALAKSLVESQGESVCSMCHGSNGN